MSVSDDDNSDDRDDDPMLRSMRAVWVSMRDEEPPATGLDALLSAARQQAARMQPEKSSWWQQLLASLRRPPVLALATVVVLMGGAIVIGGHRDKLEVKPTIATSEMTEQPDAALLGHEQRESEGKLQQDHGGDRYKSPVAPEPVDEKNRAVTIAPTVIPPPPPPPPPRVPQPTRSAPKLGVAGEAQAGSGAASPEPDRPGTGSLVPDGVVITKESSQNLPRDSSQLEIAVDGRDTPKKDTLKDSEPAMRRPTVDTTKTPQPAPQPAHGAPAPRAPASDQLVKQTENAAANGDCAAVRVMAERIRKIDSEAYNTRVKASASIAKCLK